AGARAALLRAPGSPEPDALAARRRPGPGARARGDDPERGHPEPHPRGQGPPDLLDDADRPGPQRHADPQPVALLPLRAAHHQLRGRDRALRRPDRAPEDDPGGDVPGAAAARAVRPQLLTARGTEGYDPTAPSGGRRGVGRPSPVRESVDG